MGSALKRSASKVKNNNSKKAKVQKTKPVESSSEEDELDMEEQSPVESDESDALDNVNDDDESDELDSGSDDEKDSLDEDSSDDEEQKTADDKPVDPNKKSSKEQHAEQRKLLSERKLQRKSGQEVQQIKNIWEKLRVKKPTPPKEIRNKLCDEMWALAKDVIADLVLKHDASRVVQTLVKFASKERREDIVKQLQGSYYQLATSSYGKYLLVKLLHYGSKESRALIVNELHGKLRKLMRHKEGAYVVEDLYVLYSTMEQRQQMIREFWGAEYAVFKESGKGKSVLDVCNESSEKKHLIMTNLNGTIVASVEKGSTGFQILHAAMKDYVTILLDNKEANDSKIREFIELLAEQFAELVHTNEGADVACKLISVATAKERKVIIRSLKQHSTELVKNENGNVVLITLFMTVDDTVLLHKTFNADLFTDDLLPPLLQDKFSRRPLLYLVKGLDGKYFAPNVKKLLLEYESLAYSAHTKKPQDQRRKELSDKALPLVYQVLIDSAKPDFKFPDLSLSHTLSSNLAAQTISEILLVENDSKDRLKVIDEIFNVTVKGDVLEDYHLLNKSQFTSRLLKSLIQGKEFAWDNEQKKLIRNEDAKLPGVGLDFACKVADEVLKSVDSWITGQGAFVLVSTLEVLQLAGNKKANELKKALKKVKKTLQEDEDNKGAQLLLKQI